MRVADGVDEVIERIRKIRKRKSMIRGNHDKVVCGLDSGELFNPVALKAARWTAERYYGGGHRNLKVEQVGKQEFPG